MLMAGEYSGDSLKNSSALAMGRVNQSASYERQWKEVYHFRPSASWLSDLATLRAQYSVRSGWPQLTDTYICPLSVISPVEPSQAQ